MARTDPAKASRWQRLHTYLDRQEGDVQSRRSTSTEMTSAYYDLATDFYEYGWGTSFHFAPLFRNESLRESLVRCECWLAHRLELSSSSTVLDLGCGVGGPMRTIARFSGARIVGININPYQVQRARQLNELHGAVGCDVVEADFMDLPMPDASVNAVYAIEAITHASDATRCFSEARRVLKPGGLFGSYEWCMTRKFDPMNPRHQHIKREIEMGCGIAHLSSMQDVLDSVRASGLELLEHEDRAVLGDQPWWQPLAPRGFSLSPFRSSPAGARVTNALVGLLEAVRVAPRGSLQVGRLLARGGRAVAAGGREGIFTPSLFLLARAPG